MADFSALFQRKRKLDSDAVSVRPPNSTKPQGTAGLSSSGVVDAKRQKKRSKRKQQKASNAADRCSMPDDSAGAPAAAPTIAVAGSGKLQRRMAEQLAGAQFRYINELLYTQPSADAVRLFKEEPRMYEAYHQGFRSQAARWPQRPVQLIAEWLKQRPKKHVVADLGCGDAELAMSVPNQVHSFDLVACNERVVACDISAVPLEKRSVHVAVFCLALMGSNFVDFLREAHRILRKGGTLKIAEVASRIDNIEGWDALLHGLGFDMVDKDDSNTHFVMYEYTKSAKRAPLKKLPIIYLKPCMYKKR